MIHAYTINGLKIQTGDILCLAFDGDHAVTPGDYWRILGLLIPGEVDHVAVYIGPEGRCVEASAKGVYTFDLEDNEWAPEKMFEYRGTFMDHLVGVAYPLHDLGLSEAAGTRIRRCVSDFCMSQVEAGAPYNINLLNPDREDAFYCSQLAYKAYLPHGINLNTGQGVPNLPGTGGIVFPQEIWRGCFHRRASNAIENGSISSSFAATFSIAAYDPNEPAWGVAVASKFLAVGAVVPWAQAGAGAVATQSYANPTYGPRGLERMAAGLSAAGTLDRLLATDPERERRQVGLVDAQGRPVTFTGGECHPWAGGRVGPGFAVQGNMLAGAEVVTAMSEAFTRSAGDLPTRLHKALLAGEAAGGDRRGRQSAAILVAKPGGGYSGLNDRWVDYRVDDHPNPIARLGELLELHHVFRGEIRAGEQVELTGNHLRRLQLVMKRQGFYSGAIHGQYDSATRAALEAFLVNENLRDRADMEKGWITRPAFEYLLRRFGDTET